MISSSELVDRDWAVNYTPIAPFWLAALAASEFLCVERCLRVRGGQGGGSGWVGGWVNGMVGDVWVGCHRPKVVLQPPLITV